MTKSSKVLKQMVDALAMLEAECAENLDSDLYDVEFAELQLCEAIRSYVRLHKADFVDDDVSQRNIAYAFDTAQRVGLWFRT